MKSTKKKRAKRKADPLEVAQLLAKGAGEILLKAGKKIAGLTITVKDAQGVASSADLAAEKFLIKNLRAHFPTHQFLAEESSFLTGQMSPQDFAAAEYCWVIDPLDGTHNFLNGLNYFGVCLALAHRGEIFLGVVYRPSTGELFFAQKGRGAFVQLKGGKKQKLWAVKNPKELANSLLCTGFAAEKGGHHEDEFRYFQTLFANSRGVRRMGSAALDLCLVAQGVFDGFWEKGLAPWDMAAAGLICQESGVVLSDFCGGPYHPYTSTILAARPPMHEALLKLMRKTRSVDTNPRQN